MSRSRPIYKDPSFIAAARANERNRTIRDQVLGVYEPLRMLPNNTAGAYLFAILLASQVGLGAATANRRARREEQYGVALMTPSIHDQNALGFLSPAKIKHYKPKLKTSTPPKVITPSCPPKEMEAAFLNEQIDYFSAAINAGHININDPIFIQKGSKLSLLAQTVRFKKQKLMEYLLLIHADPNWQSEHGLSALHLAAEYNAKAIPALIAAGANPNIASAGGTTPLMIAAASNPDAVLPLVNHGAEIGSKNPVIAYIIQHNQPTELRNILHIVTEVDEPSLTEMWKKVADQYGEETIIPKNEFQNIIRTAVSENKKIESFSEAVVENNIGLIKSAFINDPISLFVNIVFHNTEDNSFDSLLFHCIRQHKTVILEHLISRGLDIQQTEHGQTALHYAASHAPEAIAYLVGLGADRHAKDDNGNTAYHIAAASGDSYRLAHAAVIYRDENPIGNDNATPLLIVATHHPQLINLILENNPKNIDLPNTSSLTTPLLAAAKNGHYDAVRSLIAHKANVKAADKNKMTALHFAAIHNPDLIPLLVKAGAKVNVKNAAGETPLLLAIKQGTLAAIQQLREAGATFDMEEVKLAFEKREDAANLEFKQIEWILLEMNYVKLTRNFLLEAVKNPAVLIAGLIILLIAIARSQTHKIKALLTKPGIDYGLKLLNQINSTFLNGTWEKQGERYTLNAEFSAEYRDEKIQHELFDLLKSFLKEHNASKLTNLRKQWQVSHLKINDTKQSEHLFEEWQKQLTEFNQSYKMKTLGQRLKNEELVINQLLESHQLKLTQFNQSIDSLREKLKSRIERAKTELKHIETSAETLKQLTELFAQFKEKYPHYTNPFSNFKNPAQTPADVTLTQERYDFTVEKVEKFKTDLKKDDGSFTQFENGMQEMTKQIHSLLAVAENTIASIQAEKRRKQFVAAFADISFVDKEEIPGTTSEIIERLNIEPIKNPQPAQPAQPKSALPEALTHAPYLLREQRPLTSIPSPLVNLSVLTTDPQYKQASTRLHLDNIKNTLDFIASAVKNDDGLEPIQVTHSLLYYMIRLFQSCWEISGTSTAPSAIKIRIEQMRHFIVHFACFDMDSEMKSKQILELANALHEKLLFPINDLCQNYQSSSKDKSISAFIDLVNNTHLESLPLFDQYDKGLVLSYEDCKTQIETAFQLLNGILLKRSPEAILRQRTHLSACVKMLIVRIGEHWHVMETEHPKFAQLLYGHLPIIVWTNNKNPLTILKCARIIRNNICHKDNIAENRRSKREVIYDVRPEKITAFLNQVPAEPIAREILNRNAAPFTPK